MNKPTLFLSIAALSTLLTGCVGVGPNTQQGAVTGGTLGAIAGAIIGHNSRGGDTLGGALIGGAAGAIAGGTIGNSVDNERGTLYQGSRPTAYRTMGPPPMPAPPPTAEIMTAPPAPNALWIPGYWNYTGRGYSWVAAHWEIPPPTAHNYMAAHWEYRGRHYVFVPGYWM